MAVFDFFQHIIIDIVRRDDDRPVTIFFIEEICHLLQQGLAPFKMLAVVIADEHVHHTSFGVTGMDTAAMKGDDRIGSIEVFIFQSAQFTAIDSIGKISPELLHIE